MNSYIISYDLVAERNYDALIAELETYNYWHCLESTWIVKSDESTSDIHTKLGKHIDGDDLLIVIKAVRDASWSDSFSQECQDWLQKNL